MAEFNFTNEEYYDASLKVPYPFSSGDKDSFMGFESEGKEYLVIDSYCKNPDCPCSIVSIEIIERTNLKERVTVFHYDYALGVIIEELLPVPQFVIDDLKQDDELNSILAKRNVLIRRGFADYSFKRESLKTQHSTLNKLGRNDPCSCGSGKKFKKCCGF